LAVLVFVTSVVTALLVVVAVTAAATVVFAEETDLVAELEDATELELELELSDEAKLAGPALATTVLATSLAAMGSTRYLVTLENAVRALDDFRDGRVPLSEDTELRMQLRPRTDEQALAAEESGTV
jgi:hypothetical protein